MHACVCGHPCVCVHPCTAECSEVKCSVVWCSVVSDVVQCSVVRSGVVWSGAVKCSVPVAMELMSPLVMVDTGSSFITSKGAARLGLLSAFCAA